MNDVFGLPAGTVSAMAAIAAVLISLVAIFLAIFTAWLQRTHNRLSVRPLAEIMVRDMEGQLRVKLCNHGTGPLIVKKLRVLKPGNPTVKSLVEAMPEAIDGWEFFVGDIDGRSIPSNGSLNLLELKYNDDEQSRQVANSVRGALQHLSISLSFADIYKRKMPKYLKSLEWFGRTL